ncbi:MAG: O-antigen ligase family protein [Chloroflexota bacterium]|nr:O-antigen ligase family protein [Chloroflexota bacterium]
MLARAQRNLNWLFLLLAFLGIAGALIVLPLTSAVVVIGGALAAIAILRLPELALYALVFAVPYGSWFPVSIGAGNLTAVDLLVALVIALWLARMIVQERGITIRLPPLALPFALFLFAALLSMTVALSLQAAVKEFAKWAEMFAIYVFVANTLDETKLPRVLVAMFLAGLSEAAIGIYQFLFRVGPEGFTLFDRFMRAYGTFEQPNPYAGYLALIAPVALGVVLTVNSKQSTVNSKADRWSLFTAYCLLFTAWGALVAMLAAVVMSWSRGAWLGVAAGLVVAIIVQSRRAFVLSIIAAFVLTFVILLSSISVIPGAISARFSGVGDYFGVFDVRGVKVDDSNYAIVERMAHWQAAAEMFVDYPLLGVGIGNYAPVYPAYALPGWSDPLGHAHNYYLNVAAETGLIGLIAYQILWLAAFWQSWRAVRVTRGWQRGVAAGLLGMLVALSIHNGFDDLFVHGMSVQVGIGLGIVGWLRASGRMVG